MFSSKTWQESEVTIDETRFHVDGFTCDFTSARARNQALARCLVCDYGWTCSWISDHDIARGLTEYKSVEGRGNRTVLPGGTVLIDESYNADPDSVKCAVDAVLDDRAFPQKRKYIVLGEMAELGDSAELMHKQTGEWLKDKQFTMLITVGPKAAVIAAGALGGDFAITKCDSQDEVFKLLRSELTADTCVMIKGSHCANLESLVARLTKESQEFGLSG